MAPLLLVLLAFFGVPLLMVVAVSFFEFDGINSVPAFQLANYVELFSSQLTLTLYLKTVEYALMVWAITLVIGFTRRLFSGFPRAQLALADGACCCCARCRSGPRTSFA